MKTVNYRHSYTSQLSREDEMQEKFGQLLYEEDTSEDYETQSSHLFRDGDTYTWIDANGCSCWDGDFDGWQLTQDEIVKLANKEVEHVSSDRRLSASELVAQWIVNNIK